MRPQPTLLTFGPMIDSELCRLLLDWYGVAYHEERHLFGWVSVLAILRAGTPQVPVLTGDGPALIGPRALVDRYDATAPTDRRLLPAGEPLRTAVEADWWRFNGELAAHTAAIAYFYLLPNRDILIEPFSRGVPAREAALTRPAYPLLRALFVVLLRLRPARVADALLRVRAIVDGVDARMKGKRGFLHGPKMTLADLAFASALCPLSLPTGCTSPLPPPDQMPASMQAILADIRSRPSFELAERSYQTVRKN